MRATAAHGVPLAAQRFQGGCPDPEGGISAIGLAVRLNLSDKLLPLCVVVQVALAVSADASVPFPVLIASSPCFGCSCCTGSLLFNRHPCTLCT